MCTTESKMLTTKDVAKVLDVSESSVKRWIDDGSLRAEKTPGGHRRIAMNDLDIFIRSTGRTSFDKKSLGIPEKIDFENFGDVYQAYLEALRVGDAFTMDGVIRCMLLSGEAIESVIDRIVYPAFLELRKTCHHPSEECLVLHRAIDITRRIIDSRVGAQGRRLSDSSKIVFADIGYDVDALPTFLAEAAVMDLNNTLQLGVSVPENVLVGSLDHKEIKAVFMSAGGPLKNRRTVDTTSQKVFKKCEDSGIPCFVFGDFFKGKDLRAYPSVQMCSNFSALRGASKSLS
jgi:excisionase family DNA binding protein